MNELAHGWRAAAVCADTPVDWFFPSSGEGIPDEVLTLCSICPVRQPCLDHALRHEDHGIWAGTSERGRRRLRSAMRIRLVEPTLLAPIPPPPSAAEPEAQETA